MVIRAVGHLPDRRRPKGIPMLFSRWGAFVYRFRRPFAVVTIVLAVASLTLASRVTGALNHTEGRGTQIVHRQAEIRMVQQIEELKAQFKSAAFAKLKQPRKIRVEIDKARAEQRIVPGIPISARTVRSICRRVDPRESLCVSYVRAANDIGTVKTHAGEGGIYARHRRERKTVVS